MASSASRTFNELLESIAREYRDGRFENEDEIREHCRTFFENQIFVIHTSLDHEFCKTNIVPVMQQFGVWGHFLMNRTSASPAIVSAYRFMVEHTLACCKTIVIILSKHSVESEWVQLETQWAVEQGHPILVCRLDQTAPEKLHVHLSRERRWPWSKPPLRMIEFHRDLPAGQRRLDRLLHTAAFAPGGRTKGRGAN